MYNSAGEQKQVTDFEDSGFDKSMIFGGNGISGQYYRCWWPFFASLSIPLHLYFDYAQHKRQLSWPRLNQSSSQTALPYVSVSFYRSAPNITSTRWSLVQHSRIIRKPNPLPKPFPQSDSD
ncbi:MAG: hypothetical protein ACJAZ9_001663 [Neolewinella sp.]|jgi:hypothetical protein